MLRILLSLSLFLFLSPLFAQEQESKKESKKDSTSAYEKLIGKDAITQDGLFKVHKVKSKYYFELPKQLLGKEILVVSRISGFVEKLNFGGAGIKSRPQQVIRFERKDNMLLLRSVSYNNVAEEDLPIYTSVKNNNFEPIIMAFPIKSMPTDSNAYVIDVKNLFTTDVDMLGAMYASQEKSFGIKGVDSKRSFIDEIKVFPKNVNVKHVLTYKGGDKLPANRLTGTLSVEMTQSFIELPEKPMQAREYDPRVSYFSIRQTDYGSDAQKADKKRYITRWRLEPKDPEAYARGELVEPVKPIVYYIDPATPKEWAPYIKMGVDDWNAIFEEAGFKNAIMGKYAPTKEEDPDWDPEDVRYSVIRYITTDIQNAMGPHVHDPRTGEILESDIMWYHNVMNLLRNWYFIQTAAVNPEARHPKFRTEVMGQLIRFVSAHEVGHTLGLPHNMGSSVAYPVDSLRSPSFTARMGTAPSIMDYARFNYIAQPEDKGVSLHPQIGIYDRWSIEFGYRLYPGESTASERTILNEEIKARENNPLYRFGRQHGPISDYTAQTEDLGDDAMRASNLGIKNLKRILPNLISWTAEDHKEMNNLKELYENLIGQYRRYVGHVCGNVGGVKEVFKTYDQNAVVYTPAPYEKQKRAVQFLDQQLFTSPLWLLDHQILDRIENQGSLDRINKVQNYALSQLYDAQKLKRMLDQTIRTNGSTYTVPQLFEDVYQSIFRELISKGNPDHLKRQLQSNYVSLLIKTNKDEKHAADARSLALHYLEKINSQASKYKSKSAPLVEAHYAALHHKIDAFLKATD